MKNSGYDYAAQYDDFWSRPDRQGTESYLDRDDVIDKIIRCVGYGRVLDLGCGEGRLVRGLLERGVDAYGIDVSSVAVSRGEQFIPGRLHCGSVLQLPFGDQSFDGVVSTDCLEHIHPDDIPQAVREIRRVCRSYAYFHIATTQDRDNHWHLTVEGRDWWESVFFNAGFIRHASYYQFSPIAQLAEDHWQICVAFSTPPERTLLDGGGVMAAATPEGHVYSAAYAEIAEFLRPGDTVLSWSEHGGEGAYVAFAESSVDKLIAFVKNDTWSPATNAEGGFQVRRSGEFSAYCGAEYGSIGAVILEHGSIEQLLDGNVYRCLRPGGRVFLVTTETVMVDDEFSLGGDRYVVESRKAVELKGAKLKLLVLLTCLNQPDKGYQPTLHGYSEPPRNLINFCRAYDNPWLPFNVFIPGIRTSNVDLLVREAARVLADERLSRTPDRGGALAVLGYRLLERGDSPFAMIESHIASVAEYLSVTSDEQCPHVFRWRVSLSYLTAKLYSKMGSLESSLEWLQKVAETDVSAFSPTLGTKVVSAAIEAGNLLAGKHDLQAAGDHWLRGALVGFELLKADESEWIGRPELPLKGAAYEAVQLADLINTCLLSLRAVKRLDAGRTPFYRIWQESSDSVFVINRKRLNVIFAQGERLNSLEHTCNTQGIVLEERWNIMQAQGVSIADRDEAIAAQGRMLEERWRLMEEMGARIARCEQELRQRDARIDQYEQELSERKARIEQCQSEIAMLRNTPWRRAVNKLRSAFGSVRRGR